MTTASKITLVRIFLIPVVMIMMYLSQSYGSVWLWIALAVFIIASLSDYADGFIARKYNQITDFGKFLDPLADKLLVCSAMICLIDTNELPSWIVIIIIAREFIISGFRLVAADNGIVIAASIWGKIKTITQMVMIIFILLNFKGSAAYVIEQALIYAALVLTVVSLVDYIIKNKAVLGTDR